MKKANFDHLWTPLPLILGGFQYRLPPKNLGCRASYLKTLFEQKQKMENFDHFRLNDPLDLYESNSATGSLLEIVTCSCFLSSLCLPLHINARGHSVVASCIGKYHDKCDIVKYLPTIANLCWTFY